MKNYVEFEVNKHDARNAIKAYEEQGLLYRGTRTSAEQAQNHLTTIIFEGNRDTIANQSNPAKMYLEFDDGTVSPLYIKKERKWDE